MKGKYQKLIIIGIVAVFFLVAFGNSMFIKLEATERGVIFRQFSSGLDKDNVYEPGFHEIWINSVTYPLRNNGRA